MKKLILVVALAICAGNANAGERKEFDGDARQLLAAVFQNCPIQFIQAMKGADQVGKAVYSSPRPADGAPAKETYEITTLAGGFAPDFKSYQISTLTITRTEIRDEHQTLDRPTEWKVSCQLSAPKLNGPSEKK